VSTVSESNVDDPKDSLEIAVIGMACRYPGARNVSEFWNNLRDGVESISSFSDEELQSMGVDLATLCHPKFVKAGAILKDPGKFDAAFFGYSPKEAELLDPQHRVFLECAWEALESAGYTPDGYSGLIGVYAGMSLSTYLLFNLMAAPAAMPAEDPFQVMISNDKDFLSTRVSYELNLKGPSITVQTGCSTSLVAVHLASQGLLNYQCDLALAGGISIQVPQRTGYFYQDGGINSSDGHCRAFDAKGDGTIFGSGAGIVVLKRLTDAIADNDNILAVIKGSAINNDGASKIGYTAPSVDGQAQVISMAHLVAGVEPETITYIEAHGTATGLGDPVEIAALTKAFGASTNEKGFCAVGSVKTNIGHTDAAAGIAGLIKTVLALEHKQLPPSLNFESPNPKIDFENSPFYVNAKLCPWKANGTPRRAGVSSFGIGGTNAHVILEEAPKLARTSPSREFQLLAISARTRSALEQATTNLAEYLAQHQSDSLAEATAESLGDIAYTLQIGRKLFEYRRMLVCRNGEEAVAALTGSNSNAVFTTYEEADDRPVIFMFPGGGSQYVNMARGLFLNEPFFRHQLLSCFDILRSLVSFDLSSLLFPSGPVSDHHSSLLSSTSLALPALFCVEYSLARLWMHWGIRPQAMIGHSLGEYVAACLSGVFSLADALSLVVTRGRLFEQLPSGAMLSVPLSESELSPLLNGNLSIAAINSPVLCVISGANPEIEAFSSLLANMGVEYRRIHIDVAAHSHLVEPILGRFEERVESMALNAPTIPFLSNVTGDWMTQDLATDPDYWVKHLRQPVRFSDGLQKLMKEPDAVLLEIGPGQTLSSLAKLQAERNPGHVILSSVRHPHDPIPDEAFILTTLGKLWMSGLKIDWDEFYRYEQRRRVATPTYPFERKQYWRDPSSTAESQLALATRADKDPDLANWFYINSWKMTLPIAAKKETQPGAQWLIFADDHGLGTRLAKRLKGQEQEVVLVTRGRRFHIDEENIFTIDERSADDYREIIKSTVKNDKSPLRIVHLWSLSDERSPAAGEAGFYEAQFRGCMSLLFIAQSLLNEPVRQSVDLWVIANGLAAIEQNDRLMPEKATLLGPAKVIPQELDNVAVGLIDVPIADATREDDIIDRLILELTGREPSGLIAYRSVNRWEHIYEPVRLEKGSGHTCRLRDNGVYLITGGLGGVGFLIARYLAEQVKARLVLTSRTALPPKDQWEQWVQQHDEDEAISRQIKRAQELELLASEVMIANADVADERQMRAVLDRIIGCFGDLHGVIHAAGFAGEKTLKLVTDIDAQECEKHFRAKVHGVYTLKKILDGRNPEFCLLISSNASILGGLGSAGYAAANTFLDTFASAHCRAGGIRWISTNWDGWLLKAQTHVAGSMQTSLDQYAMKPEESVEAFNRVVTSNLAGQIIVSTGNLAARLNLWVNRRRHQTEEDSTVAPSLHIRPKLEVAYLPPSNHVEQVIARVWQDLLGIENLGINDNFFDLGGNSLIGLRVISRLKAELNVDLSIVSLFEGPTVKALAEVLARDKGERMDYEEDRNRGERRRKKRLRHGKSIHPDTG
jgi:phthiocerol/phenolphthiocerol synthesis type-I polyketide synthase E